MSDKPEPIELDAEPAAAVAHTPGPWTVGRSGAHSSFIGSNGRNSGIWIAEVKGPDNAANARLIAAAPDLRGAGSALIEAVSTYRTAHDLHGDGSREAGRAWDLMRRAESEMRAALAQASAK